MQPANDGDQTNNIQDEPLSQYSNTPNNTVTPPQANGQPQYPPTKKKSGKIVWFIVGGVFIFIVLIAILATLAFVSFENSQRKAQESVEKYNKQRQDKQSKPSSSDETPLNTQAYPSYVKNNYLNACLQKGAPQSYCQCTFKYLEDRLSFRIFAEYEVEAQKSGNLPTAYKNIIDQATASCS